MPLESVTYISDLVATNPVNATDQVAQGDDHIRNIKAALLNTFPGITGAVTASHAELNILDGATLSVAELNILDGVTATAAELNILDGATLSVAELNILDGVTLTAAQINDAARKGVANTFTATQTLSNGNSTQWTLTNSVSSVGGYVGLSAAEAYFGSSTNHPVGLYTNGSNRLAISGGGDFDFKAGTVTTNGASAAEVGYNGVPQVSVTAGRTLALTDRGKTIRLSTNGSQTVTIPPNSDVAFPIGTIIKVIGWVGSSTHTIARGSGVNLYLKGSNFTDANRTLTNFADAVLEKIDTNAWGISGVGVS